MEEVLRLFGEDPWIEFALLFTAFAASLVGNWKDLHRKGKRAGAWMLLTLAFLTLSMSALGLWAKTKALQRLQLTSIDRVDEASGGTTIGDNAYVVDDEDPRVYRFKVTEKGLALAESIDLSNVDILEPQSSQAIHPDDGASETKKAKARDLIDDFEGAATDGTDLFLVTSQGYTKFGNKDPKRVWFVQVSLSQPGRLIRAIPLRDSIGRFLQENDVRVHLDEEECKEPLQSMQLEGLAIVPNPSRVLFGFRTPLSEKKEALIVETPLEELLENRPDFRLHRVALRPEGDRGFEDHGIVSMEFDETTGAVLLLSNLPSPNDNSQPFLWCWRMDTGVLDHPPRPVPVPFSVTHNVGRRLEVVLCPRGSDKLLFLLDNDGFGGQKAVTRKSLDLSLGSRP